MGGGAGVKCHILPATATNGQSRMKLVISLNPGVDKIKMAKVKPAVL
jgi:hypothetical protein